MLACWIFFFFSCLHLLFMFSSILLRLLGSQWDRDLNEIKDAVKETIEQMAVGWTADEKIACVQETKAAFQGGGAINSYLSGGGAR
jgi:hypothetical protein